MNDAETQLARRLALDLGQVLGATIDPADVEIAGDGPARITVTCRLHGEAHPIEAAGESAVDASGRILRVAAEHRLSAAFRELVG